MNRHYFPAIFLVFSLFLLPVLVSAESFPVTMQEGEERTFNLGNQQYEVEVMIIEDATPATVTFNINGEITPQLVAQAHYTLKDGTHLDVLDIWLNEAGEAGSGDTVTFSLSFCGGTVCNGEENSQSCAKDCGSQENIGLPSYTLENTLLRFAFDENGSLQTISHKPSAYIYTLQQQQPWQVSIYNASRSSEVEPLPEKPAFVLIGNTDNLQECTVQSSGIQRLPALQRLEYRWACSFASPGDPQKSTLTVTTSYELQDTKDYLETWSTTSITSPKYSVFKLYYPLGVVEDSSVTEYGITSGYVFEATREPAYNVVPFESYSLQNVLGGQWNDRDNYLYFMTDDDGYGVKQDSYTAANGVFTTNMILLAQNYFEPGNSIDAPYRLRIGVGKGLSGEEGWLPIADAYRQHLQDKGSLAIPIAQRGDIPDFVKNMDLTLFNGALPYPLSVEEQQQLATAYHNATAYYGAKNVNLLLWENGKMIPFYEPQPTQVDFYRALRGEGVVPCVYTIYSRMPLRDPAYEQMNDEANFISPWQQRPALTPPVYGEPLAFFDPHSDKFINWFVARLKVLSDNGRALGCVYHDDTYTNGGYGNGLWNPSLNGQRKYGITDDVLRGGVQYYGKIGAKMNTVDNDFFLFHESFVASANFVGGPDVQSSRSIQFASSAHPLNLENTVQHFFFLERVFSGYNVRKGAAVESSNLLIQHPFVLPEYRNLDPRLANYPFDIYDDYPLAVAVGVLQGGGIPITPEYGIAINSLSRQVSTVPNYRAEEKPDWSVPYFKTFLPLEAKFIKEMVRVVQLGRLYFQGQWQLPLETDSPKDEHKFVTWGTTSYDIFSVQEPRVINSVWKAWNGELGLFFANTYRQEERQVVTFNFDFDRYGLQRGKNYDLIALDNTTTSPLGEQILGIFDDDFSYTFTLPSLRATVFALRLSGNKPPQVNAGLDQSIILPTSQVNIDGAVTDDGLPNPPGRVTILWTKESGAGPVIFDDVNALNTTVTFSKAGTYILRLTADDGQYQRFDEITIVVLSRLNNPPILDPIGSREVMRGALLQFTVIATDPNNDTLTYNTINLPEGATFIKQEFNWRPHERQVGYYNVTFTVTDDGIPPLSDSETITIFVNQSNVEPDLDSDGDGVPDSQDQCPNTPPAQYQRINRLNGCPEPQLNWNRFDQNLTTNFSTVRDLFHVDDLRLGVAQKGMIHYINQSLPLVQFDPRTGRHEPLVLDTFIDIDYNMVKVDTKNATGNYTAFDRPATITLLSLPFTSPRILRDGVACDMCQIISYTNGDLIFVVPGFSTYTTEETPSSGGGGSSSGGGSGGGGGRTSRIAVDLDAYTQQTVSPLITGVLALSYKNMDYQGRLSRSTSSSIILAFRSLGLTLSLELNQRTSVDLDGDGVADITITLISLQRNTATLTFARLPNNTPKLVKELRGIGEADKEVKELIEDKQTISSQKPQKGSGLLISFLLFLLGGIVLGVFFLFRSFRVRI